MGDLRVVAIVEARDDRFHLLGTKRIGLWRLVLQVFDIECRCAIDNLVVEGGCEDAAQWDQTVVDGLAGHALGEFGDDRLDLRRPDRTDRTIAEMRLPDLLDCAQVAAVGGFLDRQASQPPVREVAEISGLGLALGKRLLLRFGLPLGLGTGKFRVGKRPRIVEEIIFDLMVQPRHQTLGRLDVGGRRGEVEIFAASPARPGETNPDVRAQRLYAGAWPPSTHRLNPSMSMQMLPSGARRYSRPAIQMPLAIFM
ncbi:hypothetical protein QGN17_05035 [Sphingomonas sp. MAHUQ-71]|uniref:Uncharacterized protein n=1 Tax=Sphingomonas oryzagri TaxID=3042314 RepID=A0ABT6MYF8_9SPHN|nr:hypothetical protein [Sphingomonas oryzagri]MDH7638086.1 hypothetical protein [Sphingomonas oryzagri]